MLEVFHSGLGQGKIDEIFEVDRWMIRCMEVSHLKETH